jgi:hypothetical protein
LQAPAGSIERPTARPLTAGLASAALQMQRLARIDYWIDQNSLAE